MRSFLLAVTFGAACMSAVQADILANSDFADGSAHWQGDRTTDTDARSVSIPLQPATWTKIYQDFHSADAALKMHVAYSLSPNCTFFPQNGMAQFFVSSETLLDIAGVRVNQANAVAIPMGGFLGVIEDPSKPLVFSCIMRGKVTSDIQTSEGFFYDLNPHAEKTFYLAFPPGQGTVTLSSVSLEPAPNGPTRDNSAGQ